MSITALMLTVANDTTVSLVTPGMQSPDGYVKLVSIDPGIEGQTHEPFDAYLYFRVRCDRGIAPRGRRGYEEGLVASHIQKLLVLDNLQDKLELTSLHWYV